VFHQPTPARTGQRGRPRLKGDRTGPATDIANSATWRTVTVTRSGITSLVQIAEVTCLWFGTWRTDPVRVILLRDRTTTGYDLALVTTDPTATAAQIIARYTARWSIKVMFLDVNHLLGVGQARNRARTAVERTVPFGLLTSSIMTIWYALYGHHTTDTTQRRAAAPWYTTKTEPSTLDMLTKPRRLTITARSLPTSPDQPQPKKPSRSSTPGPSPPPELQKSSRYLNGEDQRLCPSPSVPARDPPHRKA
jgi:hypothetical protein